MARGEEGELPFVVAHLAATAWMTGDLEVAEHEATDAVRLATLIGQDLVLALALMVRASVRGTRGDAARSRADAAEALAISERIGWWYGVNQSRWAQAVLALSEDAPSQRSPRSSRSSRRSRRSASTSGRSRSRFPTRSRR